MPRWIADLVVHLQAVATEGEPWLPPDTFAAHGQLLDLRSAFMPPLPAELRSEYDEVPRAEELVPYPKAGAAR